MRFILANTRINLVFCDYMAYNVLETKVNSIYCSCEELKNDCKL